MFRTYQYSILKASYSWKAMIFYQMFWSTSATDFFMLIIVETRLQHGPEKQVVLRVLHVHPVCSSGLSLGNIDISCFE